MLASMAPPTADEIRSAVLESITDACIAVDREWRFSYVNRHAEAVLGRSRTELLGQTIWDELPDLVGSPFELEARRASAEHQSKQFEAPLPPSGVWFEATAYPSEDGVTLYLRDISARKNVEADLARHAEELTRSNEELQNFAYVASHDLQEPLRMVVSYVQLLERKYKGQLDEQADKYINYAVGGAKRMQRLINDLLAYSRVRHADAAFSEVDVGRVVDVATANLEAAVSETGTRITRGPLPTVKGDALQLTQLFQNLVANAIKFRGAAPPKIDITAEQQNQDWLFRVTDNGIGIAREYFERIFVIFQRLHAQGEYGGTGIGLALAKKIVERHGGKMWVESEPGKGSTFFFTLPDSDPRR